MNTLGRIVGGAVVALVYAVMTRLAAAVFDPDLSSGTVWFIAWIVGFVGFLIKDATAS